MNIHSVNQDGTKAVVSFAQAGSKSLKKGQKPIVVSEKHISTEFAYWGASNTEPWSQIDKIKATPTLKGGLKKKAELLYTGGPHYRFVSTNQEGEEVLIDRHVPEIHAWLWRNRHFFARTTRMITQHNNQFPEFILSEGKQYVQRLIAHEAKFARWSLQDELGLIRELALADWKNSGKWETAPKLPVLDPFFAKEDAKRLKGYKFTMHVEPDDGNIYYASPDWEALDKAGVLALSNDIFGTKSAILENQVNLKYVFHIAEDWFKAKFGEAWTDGTMTDKQKAAARLQQISDISENIQGVKNSGGALGFVVGRDPVNGDLLKAITIEPIESPFKDGMYIEDAQETVNFILNGISLPMPLAGFSTGKQTLNASGSMVREYYLLFHAMNHLLTERIMEPMRVVSDINGWNDLGFGQIVWSFKIPKWLRSSEITPSERDISLTE